jgi:hypothetical protein
VPESFERVDFVGSALQKLIVLAFLAFFILPLASSEGASDLEKYLDCSSEKKVDIVFVFDTTGSMGGEINELSSIVRGFANDLEASHIDHRLGLVEFRDFPIACGDSTKTNCGDPGDFPYRIKGDGNLTEDIDTFNSWMRELKAGGGGNGGPEAVLTALRHAVSDCHWRDGAEKVIIVITDAGPHPDGDCCNAEGDTLEGTIFGLTGEGARVYVIGPANASLKKIASDTGGQFYTIRSGLSLKPLLKEITGAMGCSFRVETEATCKDRTLAAKVQLVGKEVISYVAGQTEAWMYLDSAGNSSRYNLSYDSAAGAYMTRVPDVCGPAELTVYGRVGERSAVETVRVECGACGDAAAAEAEKQGSLSISGRVYDDSNGDGVKGADEAGLEGWSILLLEPDGGSVAQKTDRKGYYIFTGLLPGSYKAVANAQENWTATAPETSVNDVELADVHESEIDFGFRLPLANLPPTITDLVADTESPQDVGSVITWTAEATDPDNDPIVYRFFLNEESMTDWQTQNKWAWTTSEAGSYRIEAQVRDGKHAGPNELDDRRSDDIEITAPALVEKAHVNTWQRTFGIGEANSVLPTSDGGYSMLYGSFWGGTLIKTDALGNELWNYSDSYRHYNAQITIDDGCILAGWGGLWRY